MRKVKEIMIKVFKYYNYIYQSIFNKVLQKRRKKRNILLYCVSSTMEPHLMDYYKCIKKLQNTNIYLYYNNISNKKIEDFKKYIENETRITYLKNKLLARIKHYDLVVSADLALPFRFNKYAIPCLFVNHGLHIISFDEERNLYTYGKNCLDDKNNIMFTKMLESNSRIAKEVIKDNNSFANIIEPVGYKFAEEIKSNKVKYEEYRKKLNVHKDEKLVLVFGSYNSTSLFHVIGKKLIDEAKEIMNKDKYKFILSIHPLEYQKYSENIQPLGEWIESQKKYGFIVRNPKEDYIPYLISSDIVICDYSSLCEATLIANKPLILSEFDRNRVSKYSIEDKIMNIVPIFTKEKSLKEMLKNIKTQNLNKYVQEIDVTRNEYEQKVLSITKELLNLK